MDVNVVVEGRNLDDVLQIHLSFICTAPVGPDYPEIHFTNVHFDGQRTRSTFSSLSKTGRIQDLDDSGSTIVTATMFGSLDHPGWEVSRTFESLGPLFRRDVKVYLDALREIGISDFVDELMTNIELPDEKSNLEQLLHLKQSLEEATRSINVRVEWMKELHSPFMGELDTVRPKAIAGLQELKARINGLVTALKSSPEVILIHTERLTQPILEIGTYEEAVAELSTRFES